MSKNKNDKNTQFDLEPLMARVGLAACTLASMAVIAEGFVEYKHAKHPNAVLPAYNHATEQVGQGHNQVPMEMRKEEIRHNHISYGVQMRTHPVSGTV